MNTLLGLLLFLPFVVGLVQNLRVKNYVESKYPEIWKNFRFPVMGFWYRAGDDEAHMDAEQNFGRFLRSPARKALLDKRLDQLVQEERVVAIACIVAVFLAITSFLSCHFWQGSGLCT